MLSTLADRAREVLLADHSLVAMYRPTGWWVIDAGGQHGHIDHQTLSPWSPVFSHLIERPEPLLDPRVEDQPGSIIALPLLWHPPHRREKTLGACLCAKRLPARESFSATDVELGLDLARLAQSHLGRLHRLHPPPRPPGAAVPTARPALSEGLRVFLREQIVFHEGNVSAMTRDANVRQRLGYAHTSCLFYTSPSPRDRTRSRMPSST